MLHRTLWSTGPPDLNHNPRAWHRPAGRLLPSGHKHRLSSSPLRFLWFNHSSRPSTLTVPLRLNLSLRQAVKMGPSLPTATSSPPTQLLLLELPLRLQVIITMSHPGHSQNSTRPCLLSNGNFILVAHSLNSNLKLSIRNLSLPTCFNTLRVTAHSRPNKDTPKVELRRSHRCLSPDSRSLLRLDHQRFPSRPQRLTKRRLRVMMD